MGVVYLAEHPGIGRKAAVKVLHPQLTQQADIAVRFFNEARAANSIRHPGIVDVLDFGTLPSGVAYIVMEFLGGESLAKRLRAGPMATPAALRVVSQAANALGAAHAAGIVHRDLKPDNLFLVPDLRTGRGDGEGSRFRDREAQRRTDQLRIGQDPNRNGDGDADLHVTGECRGTKDVDHRTDIYALGIILYEMLCGTPPFVSEGAGELIHFHISKPPPRRARRIREYRSGSRTSCCARWPKDSGRPLPGHGRLRRQPRGRRLACRRHGARPRRRCGRAIAAGRSSPPHPPFLSTLCPPAPASSSARRRPGVRGAGSCSWFRWLSSAWVRTFTSPDFASISCQHPHRRLHRRPRRCRHPLAWPPHRRPFPPLRSS